MGWRDVPLTAAELQAWTAGAPFGEHPAAAVLVGLDPGDVARRVDDVHRLGGLGSAERARTVRLEGLDAPLRWTCPPERLTGPVPPAPPGDLGWVLQPDQAASEQPPPVRLLLDENVVPGQVVPLLQQWPVVSSVLLPAAPVPGAQRLRHWDWPFRVGVVDDDLEEALRTGMVAAVPADLVDVADVRTEPGMVDLLVLAGPLEDAVAVLSGLRPNACGVLVLDGSERGWPLVDAALTAIRAHTGARVTGLATSAQVTELPQRLGGLVRTLSHGHALDVALTAAFDRQLLLVADPAALVAADLPRILARQARQLDRDLQVAMAPPPVGAAPEVLLEPELRSRLEGPVRAGVDEFSRMSELRFDHEHLTASAAPPLRRELEEAVTEALTRQQRFLQARLDDPANVCRHGRNDLRVFVGAAELGAAIGPRLTDAQLGLDEHTDTVQLSAVCVPLIPRGEPQWAELVVPKSGRSPDVVFGLEVPAGQDTVQARVILLHRNRVVETALLTGTVDGEPVRLVEDLTLWSDLAHLDERRRFDAAVLVNRDDDGVDALVAAADGHVRVSASTVVQGLTERLRRLLIEATQAPRKGAAATEAQRALLVKAALAGRDLHTQLEDQLGTTLSKARRIQIVTARADHFLPLELVYDRPAPAKDARLCPTWTAGGTCGSECFSGDADRSVVCPAVFWGLSRVIERHYAANPSELGGNLLVLAEPRRRRRRLKSASALVGASRKVPAKEVRAATSLFGDSCLVAKSWDDWRTRLSGAAADVLVLMPHTNPVLTTMEISGSELERGYIEADYVNGNHGTSPLVLLLGCDTTGFEDDPAGYASTFMARSAAVVLGSLTMLAADHAAALSGRFAELLREPRKRAQPFGDLVTEFRREAVRSGLPSALGLCSYGDADWTV